VITNTPQTWYGDHKKKQGRNQERNQNIQGVPIRRGDKPGEASGGTGVPSRRFYFKPCNYNTGEDGRTASGERKPRRGGAGRK